MPEEYESKTIKVYGDKFAKAKNAIPAYERVLHTREVTITCARCTKTVTVQAWPGKRPRYCNDECSQAARREQTRARVKRLRQRERNAILLVCVTGLPFWACSLV